MMNMSEKQISVLPLLNQWDRCSPITKSGWGSAVNLCKRLSSNPPWSEYRVISAFTLPTQPQVALEARQELAPQGTSINDWAAMGGKEYEVVPHVAAIAQWQTFVRLGAVYIQSHDLITTREVQQNWLHCRTHTVRSLIIMASWFKGNGSWDLRTQHTDVVERCGACEQSSYSYHLELTPLHLF